MTFSELILLFSSNVGIICKGKFTFKRFLKSALSMSICHFERLIHIKYNKPSAYGYSNWNHTFLFTNYSKFAANTKNVDWFCNKMCLFFEHMQNVL